MTNKQPAVEYRSFVSYGFFRGMIRFPDETEWTVVYSSACPDALEEWISIQEALARKMEDRRAETRRLASALRQQP